jgi:hypothetical protein
MGAYRSYLDLLYLGIVGAQLAGMFGKPATLILNSRDKMHLD